MKDDNASFEQWLKTRRPKSAEIRVLVVDDDPSILHLLETALVAIGKHNVALAESASGALEIIDNASAPFDCILLDIQMPETDGIALLRKIRRLEGYSETPIIMLTAMSERHYIDDAFVAGATDYITKPFDLMDLRGRMNAAHRLVQERLKTQETQKKVSILAKELRENSQFDFDDPLVIEGADRHLRFKEFDNYIGQLSRGQIFKSHAVGIVLQDARSRCDETDRSYFRHLIHEIALCLEAATTDIPCMFSYRGGGLFLAIVHDEQSLRKFPTQDQLNHDIQAKLHENGRTGAYPHVVMSEPHSTRSLSRAGVDAAINHVISSAQRREASARQNDDLGEDGEAGGRSRRRLYERVLMELYNEECYLNPK